MPAPKRTRATATHTDDEADRADTQSPPAEANDAADAPRVRTLRRSPVRRAVSTPTRPSAAASSSSTQQPRTPTARPPRTRIALSSTSPSPALARSNSLFNPSRGANGASASPFPSSFALPGPSTRGGGPAMAVRAASTGAVPTLSQIKQFTAGSGGSGPVPPKGDGGDDSGRPQGRRFGKGKENIPPPKEPVMSTPPSENSRKRVRVTRTASRPRSTSVVSVRSESAGPAFDLRSSSTLPSPSPSPSVATTVSCDDSVADLDRTPTKKGKRPAHLLTPPPSSPLGDLQDGIEEMAMDSRTASAAPSRTTTPESESRTFPNAYRALKYALRLSSSTGASVNTAIVGREDEKAVLSSYLSLVSTCDVGMYVSGPPGTGKTALTTVVGRDLAMQGWRVVEVGVMGLKAPDVWKRLGSELGCGASEEDVIAHLKTDGMRTFIILDEIDSLLPPAPALPTPAVSHVLSKLFSLPLLSSSASTVKLVAISNTLDLTVRANLVLEGGAMPQVLPFKAYSAADMAAILTSRIASVGDGPEAAKVDVRAAELLTRKVEAQNGDLRMCLGVLSAAVGLAEAEWVKKGSPETLIKVALPHVLKAFTSHTQQLRAAAGTSACGVASPTTSKIRSVPLQGRMVLVSLLVFLMRTRAGLTGCPAQGSTSEALTTSALYATYAHLLGHDTSPFPPSPESDYRDLLSNLETLGLVSLTRARGGGSTRVELCVREDEVRGGLALTAGTKGTAEEEVARVYAREEARVSRVRARAQAIVERAEHGLSMDMD